VAAPAKETEAEVIHTSPKAMNPPYDRPSPTAGTSGRIVLESEDELKSNWKHRLYVGTTSSLLGATLLNGILQVHDIAGVAWAVGALTSAYFLSDLGTGIYHWAVDK